MSEGIDAIAAVMFGAAPDMHAAIRRDAERIHNDPPSEDVRILADSALRLLDELAVARAELAAERRAKHNWQREADSASLDNERLRAAFAAEREACATVADWLAVEWGDRAEAVRDPEEQRLCQEQRNLALEIARRIRARGEP